MTQEYKEIQKILKQIDQNEKKIAGLPKGTIFVRKINNKKYVYRNRKINGKVKSEYLGPFDNDNVKAEIQKSKFYKNGKMNIRKLRKQLEDISRKTKKESENLTDFAISINMVDGVKPDKDAIAIIRLYEKGLLTLEDAERALDKLEYAV